MTDARPDKDKRPDEDVPPSDAFVELDPGALRFRHEGCVLQCRQGEGDWRPVRVARMFPLTDPDTWISVLNKEGKELGILMDARQLERESLAALRGELGRCYLVPQIQRIVSCRDQMEFVEWTVETDRGRATFVTRRLREIARQPLGARLVLKDVEDNRYDIPDLHALDTTSRRWIEERL